jgi:ribosomal protein L15
MSGFVAPVQRPSTVLHALNVRLNPGAIKFVKKVGRGDRNGKGKYCGRGMKGYKARSSSDRAVPGFEGGQTGILKASSKFGSPYRYSRRSVCLIETTYLLKTVVEIGDCYDGSAAILD